MNGFQEYSCCELPNLLCVMTQSTEPETDCKMDESYVAGTEKEEGNGGGTRQLSRKLICGKSLQIL